MQLHLRHASVHLSNGAIAQSGSSIPGESKQMSDGVGEECGFETVAKIHPASKQTEDEIRADDQGSHPQTAHLAGMKNQNKNYATKENS